MGGRLIYIGETMAEDVKKQQPEVDVGLLQTINQKISNQRNGAYDRIAKLEDEVATLRSEIDFLKKALRNEIARYEVKMARKGTEISSIID